MSKIFLLVRTHFKQGIFQKEHIKKGHIQKTVYSKEPISKKGTFQKEYIPKRHIFEENSKKVTFKNETGKKGSYT